MIRHKKREQVQIEKRQCFCERWEKNFIKLRVSVLVAKENDVPYKGEMFDHCPWCGKELDVRKDVVVNASVALSGAGGLALGGK